MKFKKGITGYFKLGIIFAIFAAVFNVIVGMVSAPILIGGFVFGGLTGGLLTIPIIILFIVIGSGAFLHWFNTSNKFVR